LLIEGEVETLLAGGRDQGPETRDFQVITNALSYVGIVFDNQSWSRHHKPLGRV
jgi:hypothetical protein